MSYDLHILRVPESSDNRISPHEWLSCIESDPELHQDTSSELPEEWMVARVVGSEEWESLQWSGGSISASYPQQKMVSKMFAIAQRLGAVVMSDDGDIWTMAEDGRILVDSPIEPPKTDHSVALEGKTLPRGIMWPYFNYDPESDPRRVILWLLSFQPECDVNLVARFLSDRLLIPLHEAEAAIEACQSGQPIGMPAPEDFEEACLLCERLQELGVTNKGCGVRVPPW